jgi:hypothetical protein
VAGSTRCDDQIAEVAGSTRCDDQIAEVAGSTRCDDQMYLGCRGKVAGNPNLIGRPHE